MVKFPSFFRLFVCKEIAASSAEDAEAVKQCLEDGTLGEFVSALVSRHITRSLGNKIAGRVKLSPAAMEATHVHDRCPHSSDTCTHTSDVWHALDGNVGAPQESPVSRGSPTVRGRTLSQAQP